MKLLCLSNGHGEDAIAIQIIKQLQLHPHAPEIVALPIVGEGNLYTQLNIPIIAPVQKMPSGGFIYMDGVQIWRDIQGGLMGLTWAQWKAVRQWTNANRHQGLILVVGDIVPLLFAWLSGANYAFVGTAKSEYYLRDENGWLPNISTIEHYFTSVYFPWERWLISRPQCQAVFPRDSLTAKVLQQWLIPVLDLGNPMMDGFSTQLPDKEDDQCSSLTILLLPGSRHPEIESNWQKILQAVAGLLEMANERNLVFLSAIAPHINQQSLEKYLISFGWVAVSLNNSSLEHTTFTQNNATLFLTKNFPAAAMSADLAIAMAGTATEQFVGLGKPAIAIPGDGPQFTTHFAEAQCRLLGCSLILVKGATEVKDVVQSLLDDPQRLQLIAENGKRRMGKPGAAARIAESLIKLNI